MSENKRLNKIERKNSVSDDSKRGYKRGYAKAQKRYFLEKKLYAELNKEYQKIMFRKGFEAGFKTARNQMEKLCTCAVFDFDHPDTSFGLAMPNVQDESILEENNNETQTRTTERKQE